MFCEEFRLRAVDHRQHSGICGQHYRADDQPKEESVGTVITLTPIAWDNGVVNLVLQYDETALTSLKPYAVNGGSAQATATVQQRVVDQSAWQQTFSLRSGQPVIVSGLLRSETRTTRRNDKNLPSGRRQRYQLPTGCHHCADHRTVLRSSEGL